MPRRTGDRPVLSDRRRTCNPPSEEERVGNAASNAHDQHSDRYDFAYPVLSCHRLKEPITLAQMKDKYGIKGAPQGMVYVPQRTREEVGWEEQQKIRSSL
jgi:hypothetical protein